MKNKIFLILLLICATLSSCTTDSISDLEKLNNIPEITYTSTVKSVIDNNCVICHGSVPTNGASISLTTYENVKYAALTNGLLNKISQSEGTSGAMPLGGSRLPQNDINAIATWINANFPQ